ncbi:MAG: hypothetical protein WBB47_17240, partial [Paenisporosarcina sp.]
VRGFISLAFLNIKRKKHHLRRDDAFFGRIFRSLKILMGLAPNDSDWQLKRIGIIGSQKHFK